MDNVRNTKMETTFVKLSKIDVSKHIEKKGQFSYLSWPFAVSMLRQHAPTATWEVRRFDGLPYQQTELGYFVEVAVTVDGLVLSQIHPVLDSRNKPIAKPSTFDINTSIQRCLVKAIALHGLGISIYAGEDLPLIEDEEAVNAEIARIDALKQVYLKEADKGTESFRAFFNSQSKDDRNSVWSLYEKPLKDAMNNADRTLKRAA